MRSSGDEYSELSDLGGSTTYLGGRPRTGLYYSPPGTSYTILERPSSVLQYRSSTDRYRSGTGSYLSSPTWGHGKRTTPAPPPISPEQVLRMFNTTTIHRSPSSASSPPPLTYNRPMMHELTTRTVNMAWDPLEGTHGFGICVKGRRDGVGVYISRVEDGSVAERSGLRAGDSILEVNGTPFTAISHEEALKVLKSCRKLSMTVRSPFQQPLYGTTMSKPPPTCSWIDRYGRSVSPPLEYAAPRRYRHGRASSKDRSIRKVDLRIEPGQSLGLMIRGGIEYHLGIFITGVDKDSVADRAGLMIGDQILEVNGQSFHDVTHDEAVTQLKYHKRMSLVVKDVGKVPHSCTTAFRDNWTDPPGSKIAQSTRKWAAALQMVEEKARCLLSRPEFTTLCYYTDEYASKHMTIDAFIHVITELLNAPDKYTLMTELREIVAVEDRIRFDELVFQRDHDYQRSSRRCKTSPYYGGNYEEDANLSPISEDSGLGAEQPAAPPPSRTTSRQTKTYGSGDEEDVCLLEDSRRPPSPVDSIADSTAALNPQDLSDSSGYLGGLRSSLGGWTQKVKSWYWGRPPDLVQKISRSDRLLLDGDGGTGLDGGTTSGLVGERDGETPAKVVQDADGNLKVTVRKTKPILGIAIEGGANTKHPLPRIININENGAAFTAGGLEVGQLILAVDGTKVDGMEHQDIARLIAESFARRDRNDIEFLVVEPKKSNLEPKPTAYVFLEA